MSDDGYEPTESDVAYWMWSKLQADRILHQDEAADSIFKRFGDKFTYYNSQGNLAIERKVLDEFRRLTSGEVVWDRSDRFWRYRESFDLPSSRSTT